METQENKWRGEFRSDVNFPFPKKLPPWPLGPQGRVNQNFRAAMLEQYGLSHIIKTNPEAASELLLAMLIDDTPHEASSDYNLGREEMGLCGDRMGSPVAYWTSPFYMFFREAPAVALRCFIKLIKFCAEVWQENETAFGRPHNYLTFALETGNRNIVGNAQIYRMAYSSGLGGNSNLACALHALERWLYDRIDAGEDISDTLESLLRECDFLAVYSVLINVGKYRPELFKAALRPLLTNWQITYLDIEGLQWAKHSFDSFVWARKGEETFQLARDWYGLEHRRRSIVEVVQPLIFKDKSFAKWIRSETKNWRYTEHEKVDIELRAMAEQLDTRRYIIENDGPIDFSFSKSLQKNITSFENKNRPKLQDLTFHYHCGERLKNNSELSIDETNQLWRKIQRLQLQKDIEATQREEAVAAGLCLLICRGNNTSRQFNDLLPDITALLKSTITFNFSPEIDSDQQDPFRNQLSEYLALAVAEVWLKSKSPEWNAYVARVICYGPPQATSVLFFRLFPHRISIARDWYSLIHLAVLRAALSPLRPLHFMEHPQAVSRWGHWLSKLSRTEVSILSEGAVLLPDEAEIRVCRFVQNGAAWRSKYLLREQSSPFVRLDETRLLATFQCILQSTDATSFDEKVIQSLWKYASRKMQSTLKERRDEYKYPDDFDLQLCHAIAVQSLRQSNSSGYWKPLFKLGPQAHHFIERFMLELFKLSEGKVHPNFEARWRAMMEFALSDEFPTAEKNYHKQEVLRAVMGLEHIAFIKSIPGISDILVRLSGNYIEWAGANLPKDSRNVSAFCLLLESEIGRPLAARGLVAMSNCLKEEGLGYWYKSDGAGDAICNLIANCFADDPDTYMTDEETRRAILDLVAELIRKNVSASLQLQERLGRWGA